MIDTTSIRSKLYSITLANAIDYVTFVGTGLLLSYYSVSWMGGSSLCKAIVSPSIFISYTYATRHLALTLKRRIVGNFVIGPDIINEYSAFHLVGKATYRYILRFLMSRSTSSNQAMSNDPTVIRSYSKSQALSSHAFLSSDNSTDPLPKELAKTYAEVFYKYDLKPLKRILPTDFQLSIPQTCEEIMKLSPNQFAWYQHFTDHADNWKLFSLDLQDSYNNKCAQCKSLKRFIIPCDIKSIQDAKEYVVLALRTQQMKVREGKGEVDGYIGRATPITEELQQTLNKRGHAIYHSFKEEITVEEIEKFTDDEVRKHYYVYELNYYWKRPPTLVQIKLSERFIALYLEPPQTNPFSNEIWRCQLEVPTDPETIADLDDFQVLWIKQFLYGSDSWGSLSFRCQLAYNNRIAEALGYCWFFSAPPEANEITESSVGKVLTKQLYERYKISCFQHEWEKFSGDVKKSFNLLFKKYCNSELPI